MQKVFIILTILVISFNIYTVSSRAGTASFMFLDIGVGSRVIGMGEAYVGVADDINSIYWNPAGLLNIDNVSFLLEYNHWIDAVNQAYVVGAAKLNEYTALGLSVNNLKTNAIQKTDIDGNILTGQTFYGQDMAIGLTVSRKIIKPVIVGMNVKFLYQNIDNNTYQNYCVDIGTIYDMNRKYKLGMNIQNIGIATTAGDSSFLLPMNLKIGGSYKLSRFLFVSDINYSYANSLSIHLGTEYNIRDRFFLRIGYVTDFNKPFISGFRAGLGVKYKIFSIDYAIQYSSNLGYLFNLSLSNR